MSLFKKEEITFLKYVSVRNTSAETSTILPNAKKNQFYFEIFSSYLSFSLYIFFMVNLAA